MSALIPASVVDVQLNPPGVPNGGLVLLQETPAPFRYLRIIVGSYEASAIAKAFHGAPQARPMAWDLYLETLDLFRGRLLSVTITRVEEGRHFFAEIEVAEPAGAEAEAAAGEAGGGDPAEAPAHVLAARPSDALALAARREWVPIRIAAEVLDTAGIVPVASDEPGLDETELN